jgi:hypothetical protein
MALVNQIFKTLISGSGKKPSLDSMLAVFDQELENFQTLVQPDPTSKPRTPFDSPNLTFEQMHMSQMTLHQILTLLPVMLPMRVQMSKSARLYDGKFIPTQSEASPEFMSTLENMARTAGAADIRYVKVPRNAIFQHKGIPHEYAVVITVEMDKEKLANAPSFDAFLEVAKGYGNLARIGNQLAGFMRRNGFAAYPGTALGGLTDYTHLAEVAGLGVIGYHGLLITPTKARACASTPFTPTSPTCPSRLRMNTCGCAISAPCAKSAFAAVRFRRFTTNPARAVMAGCSALTMPPAAITSTRIMAVRFAWLSARSVKWAMKRSRRASRETPKHRNFAFPFPGAKDDFQITPG